MSSRRRLAPTLTTLARLHDRPGRTVAALLASGFTAGLLEAGSLVMFMTAALQLAGGDAGSVGPVMIDASARVLLLGAAISIIAAGGIHAVIARIIANGSLDIVRRARSGILASYLRAPWYRQAEVPDGVVQDSVFHLAQSTSSAAVFSLAALNSLAIMGALVVAAVVVSPTVTGTLVVALVPVVFVLRPIAQLARRRGRIAVDETGTLSEEVASTGSMALELHAFGVQEAQLARLEELNAVATDAARRARFSVRLAAFWFKDLAVLMLIIVVAVVSSVWDLTDGSATSAILVIVRSLGYAQQGYNSYTNVTELAPAVDLLVERVDDLTAVPSPVRTRRVESLGTLRFEGVGYVYPNGHQALHDVNLTLPTGRVVGVVGRSGAGKSTLAELVLRLREPTTGSISADGAAIGDIDGRDWRRMVAYVPQEPRLWRRTIAENIAFLRPDYTRDDIVAAARLAYLDDEILALPNGYDTVLGPQSRGLSGGQRQRLALARALISDPVLLVLDEPTSALDPRSEALLQETLKSLRGNVAVMLIAHRVSTLDICDEIAVVEGGTVTAVGPCAEILATHPFFARIDGDLIDGG